MGVSAGGGVEVGNGWAVAAGWVEAVAVNSGVAGAGDPVAFVPQAMLANERAVNKPKIIVLNESHMPAI